MKGYLTALSTGILMALPFQALAAGNGAPSGSHYNLNIIGKDVDKRDKSGAICPDSTSGGNRIFVRLNGYTKINLKEGAEFDVTDYCGLDGTAEFSLPDPDPMDNGSLVYSVYARALGKPGGSSTMTTCGMYYNEDTGELEEVCSLDTLVSSRTKGKQTFGDVSKKLLTITADVDGDGDIETVSLFDEALQDYFWSYDNRGLRLLQIRFYPIASAL